MHMCIDGSGALFSMVMWVQIHGGAAEYREITSHWAWQIRNLGLHKQATAQLYPPQDMSETLLATYCFSETSVAHSVCYI